jgi:hypothetical protein
MLRAGRQARDLTTSRIASFWLWSLPIVVFVAGAPAPPVWRTLLWTASLTVAGLGCVTNAVRSGRVHCYFTGPFYLLGALATLGYGAGLLPLGRSGWSLIGTAMGIGSLLLPWLPERIWGRYREQTAESGTTP